MLPPLPDEGRWLSRQIIIRLVLFFLLPIVLFVCATVWEDYEPWFRWGMIAACGALATSILLLRFSYQRRQRTRIPR
jgi:hypothetical protein